MTARANSRHDHGTSWRRHGRACPGHPRRDVALPMQVTGALAIPSRRRHRASATHKGRQAERLCPRLCRRRGTQFHPARAARGPEVLPGRECRARHRAHGIRGRPEPAHRPPRRRQTPSSRRTLIPAIHRATMIRIPSGMYRVAETGDTAMVSALCLPQK